jgi:electron transfer flavoprotein alpha/beta subunit
MTLRVLVQVWSEFDPTLNLRVDRQSGTPVAEGGDVLRRVAPLGRAGIAAALRLGDVSVTVVAIGAGHEEALRHALAAGARRAVTLTGPGEQEIGVASLAAWLEAIHADLVIADRLAGRIAGKLGWSHLAGIDQLEVVDRTLRAIRFLERGDREVVVAKLPAAVRLQTESFAVPYIARARIAAIPVARLEREVLAETTDVKRLELGPLQVPRPRVSGGSAPAAAGSANDRLQALMGGSKKPVAAAKDRAQTPDEMAAEFVRYLAHHNLLAKAATNGSGRVETPIPRS